MTYQDNSNRPRETGRYMRRENGGWGILPLALGAIALFVVGFMAMADRSPAPDRTTTRIDKTDTRPVAPKTTP